jgi:hypothetical protein
MSETFVVTGSLTDTRTVALDEAVPMSSGRVRVVVERLTSSIPRPYGEVMEGIRDRQRRRGHQPPTREAVDAMIRSEREGWEG